LQFTDADWTPAGTTTFFSTFCQVGLSPEKMAIVVDVSLDRWIEQFGAVLKNSSQTPR